MYVTSNTIYWDQVRYLQLPHWLLIFTNVIWIINIDCYSAYIWISIKTKLSQNVEGGSYDSGSNALVWVSWPSTDMYVIIIILSCLYIYIYTYVYADICVYMYAFDLKNIW